jgi:hypothetical protein
MPIDGEWYHSQQSHSLVREIEANGWKPALNTGSAFGCGIYLSRDIWHPDAKWVIRCGVRLGPDEVMEAFPVIPGFEQYGSGNSERHFQRFLVHEGVVPGRTAPEAGDSFQNRAIRDYFVARRIRAVHFTEYSHDVLVVYDPSTVSILGVDPLQGREDDGPSSPRFGANA